MAFRDDTDALRHKLDAKERQLEESEREKRELEERLEHAEDELEDALNEPSEPPPKPNGPVAPGPPPKKPMSSWRAFMIVGVIVVGVLRIAALMVEDDQSDYVIDPGYVDTFPGEAMPGDPWPRSVLGEPPPAVPRGAHLWTATVTRTDHPTFLVGTECVLMAVPDFVDSPGRVTIVCGEHSLFFAALPGDESPEPGCTLETVRTAAYLSCEVGPSSIETVTNHALVFEGDLEVELELSNPR